MPRALSAMIDLMLNGFLHMGFILVLCLVTLGAAISFAYRPGERKLGVIRPLSVATVFSILSGMSAGAAATLTHVCQAIGTPGAAGLQGQLTAGLAETMVPGILGFAMLSVAWLLSAVGLRRMD